MDHFNLNDFNLKGYRTPNISASSRKYRECTENIPKHQQMRLDEMKVFLYSKEMIINYFTSYNSEMKLISRTHKNGKN